MRKLEKQVYNQAMPNRKPQSRTNKARGTQVIPLPPDDPSATAEDETEEESGIYLEQEDIRILTNALRAYEPGVDEAQRYELLCEELEEILAVDYNEPEPGGK